MENVDFEGDQAAVVTFKTRLDAEKVSYVSTTIDDKKNTKGLKICHVKILCLDKQLTRTLLLILLSFLISVIIKHPCDIVELNC